jgi:hypothetical protein
MLLIRMRSQTLMVRSAKLLMVRSAKRVSNHEGPDLACVHPSTSATQPAESFRADD